MRCFCLFIFAAGDNELNFACQYKFDWPETFFSVSETKLIHHWLNIICKRASVRLGQGYKHD